ncbi:RagB/SusD family nutrient uptake outer membrane protein [Pontibacter qinzhouensis]|uniref:RagB/SusD family nutrient uptake outer membrane protein n=1 Tax=Pontibacter qinzhouensis TaxID=2603253 RepID=A0A5C8K7I1_9BACT|nr:RagB/SusD family nutrient uptake outer membrane protein [Pontibacter qinzhouensis]TXK45761.1 RagB/SusD family nutrient uptake outer membrane protein [Pontibacter qinzhouensis]
MKDIFNISKKVSVLALGSLIAFSACDKQLEILPQQSIGADVALSTPQGVQTALIGAYERMQGGQLYGTNINLASELLAASGDLTWTGTFLGYRQLFGKNADDTNTEAERTWVRAYQAINMVNNIIENVDVVQVEADRNRILGEALFIRGILYFELVRFYGLPWQAGNPANNPAVPLVLTPTTSITEASLVSRASVAAVYEQVFEDLNQAKSLLPEANGTRATTYTASAFLARVYLQQGGTANWASAATEADRVIASERFTLTPTYIDAFNNSANVPEYIFAIQQNNQSNAGTANDGLTTFYANDNGVGRGDVTINAAFLNNYEAADERRDAFYADGRGILRNGKFRDHYANIAVVRLPEMHLIRAEVNFRNGTTVGTTPLADINAVRSRAKASQLNNVTLEQILQERKRELAFEGFALHDAKRLQQSVGQLPYDSPNLVLPIPLREKNANPNL